MKTEELENKMTELENTKQSLAEEINNMSGTSTDSTATASAENGDTACAEANLSTACLSILETAVHLSLVKNIHHHRHHFLQQGNISFRTAG